MDSTMYILLDLDTRLVVKSSYNQLELWNEVFKNRDKSYNVRSSLELIEEA